MKSTIPLKLMGPAYYKSAYIDCLNAGALANPGQRFSKRVCVCALLRECNHVSFE